MIPKKIHYTRIWWKPLPELAKKCIESWKKNLPDYELYLRNESNFDFNQCLFIKQAYDFKKFAFVRDYIRIRAMYNYWWVTMDTDVEVLRSIDKFLIHRWFSWFESKDIIPTWIIWFEKWHPLLKKLLDFYSSESFLDNQWNPKLIANTVLITDMMKESWSFLWWWDAHIILPDDFHIYPESFFCPKNDYSKLIKDKDCYTVHYFAGSRLDKKDQKKRKIINLIIRFCKYFWIYWFISKVRRKFILKSA